jgi:hypothetical protein
VQNISQAQHGLGGDDEKIDGPFSNNSTTCNCRLGKLSFGGRQNYNWTNIVAVGQ